MSDLYALYSVCGSTIAYVDMYDHNLNPHGSICCDNCESILMCRKAWDFMYEGLNK